MKILLKNYYHFIIFMPFLYFIIGNFDDLNMAQNKAILVVPLVLSLIVISLAKLCSFFTKGEVKFFVPIFLSLIIYMLFIYKILDVGFGMYTFLLLSTPLFVTYVLRKNEKISHIFAVSVSAMFVICLIQIGFLSSQYFIHDNLETKNVKDDSEYLIKPNIYSITLDGYSRGDELKKIGHDNSYFEKELEDNGFFIANKATSNFLSTMYSMFTFWSMEFPPFKVSKDFGSIPEVKGGQAAVVLHGINNVINELRTQGYKHIRMGPNQSTNTDCSGYEDLCSFRFNDIDGSAFGAGGSLYNKLLGAMHPSFKERLMHYFPELFKRNTYLKSTVGNAYNALKKLENKLQSPYLFEVNVWQPHGPYLYDQNCKRKKNVIPYDNSWTSSLAIKAYSEETHCVNKQVLKLIKYITKIDPDGIILIASDHGHAFFYTATDMKAFNLSLDAILARSSIFWAAKMPKACDKYLYNEISPVNTFRTVFSCLKGKSIKQLPNDIYIYGGPRLNNRLTKLN